MVVLKPATSLARGFKMDSRRYASSAFTVWPLSRRTSPLYRLARDGPLALALCSWQEEQPCSWKTAKPSSLIDFCSVLPASQFWKSAGSITVIHPPIREWFVPQYWEQNRWNCPTFVGWNHSET